jgi:hypothetical protein
VKSKIGLYESAEDLLQDLDKPVTTLAAALITFKGDYTEKAKIVDVLRDYTSLKTALDIALNQLADIIRKIQGDRPPAH